MKFEEGAASTGLPGRVETGTGGTGLPGRVETGTGGTGLPGRIERGVAAGSSLPRRVEAGAASEIKISTRGVGFRDLPCRVETGGRPQTLLDLPSRVEVGGPWHLPRGVEIVTENLTGGLQEDAFENTSRQRDESRTSIRTSKSQEAM